MNMPANLCISFYTEYIPFCPIYIIEYSVLPLSMNIHVFTRYNCVFLVFAYIFASFNKNNFLFHFVRRYLHPSIMHIFHHNLQADQQIHFPYYKYSAVWIPIFLPRYHQHQYESTDTKYFRSARIIS